MLHYITGAVFLLAGCLVMLLSHNSFIGHYFHPHVLSVTHLFTLGWITTIIMGSLYQIAPVMADTRLYSYKLAALTYVFHTSGSILLAVSFYVFNTGFLLQTAGILLFLGVNLFMLNIYITTKQSEESKIELSFIQASAIWLWFTAFIGLLMVFNFSYAILPKDHIYFLKIHAHIGLLGWFLCLIIGAASKLIPMFLVSGKLPVKNLRYAFIALNSGLSGFLIDAMFFEGLTRSFIYISLIAVALMLFMLYVREAYRTRLKKQLDIGMKHTLVAVLLLAIPLLLWLFLSQNFITDVKTRQQVSIALLYSVLMGFITLLIMGQTFKNLAFIAWFYKFKELAGKTKLPLPKDMFSVLLASTQLYFFLAGYFISLGGILFSMKELIALGFSVMSVTSLIYIINVFKIIFYKMKV